MKVTLNTKWIGKEIECVKSPSFCQACKDRGKCEELDFKLNQYEGVEDCMKHDSYKRVKGAIRRK